MTHISSTSPASLMCPVMWDFLPPSKCFCQAHPGQGDPARFDAVRRGKGSRAETESSIFLSSFSHLGSALRSWLMPIWMYWLIAWSNYGLPSGGCQDTGRQRWSVMLWLRPSHWFGSNQWPPPDSDLSPFHTPRKPISPQLVHLNVKFISRRWALSALNQDICFSPS